MVVSAQDTRFELLEESFFLSEVGVEWDTGEGGPFVGVCAHLSKYCFRRRNSRMESVLARFGGGGGGISLSLALASSSSVIFFSCLAASSLRTS